MKQYLGVLLAVLVLAGSGISMAMQGMEHNDSAGSGGKMILLDAAKTDGILASIHLLDVREQMETHGMKETHHLMVRFLGTDGDDIVTGQVALKLESPDEQVSKAMKMVGMDGHFGVDIVLDQVGMYHFKIGTKFVDGKTRTFHTHFENK